MSAGAGSPPVTSRGRHRSSTSPGTSPVSLERLRSWGDSLRRTPSRSPAGRAEKSVANGLFASGDVLASPGASAGRSPENESSTTLANTSLFRAGNIAGNSAGIQPGRVWASISSEEKESAVVFTRQLHRVLTADLHRKDPLHYHDTESIETTSVSPVEQGPRVTIEDTEIWQGDCELPEYPEDHEEYIFFDCEEPKGHGEHTANAGYDGPLTNTLDIYAYTHEGQKVYMRALLDTGAGSNFMVKKKAELTGYKIEPLSRSTAFYLGDGKPFEPIGEIIITWGVNRQTGDHSNAKTYNIRFLVVEDTATYDVILGYGFLKRAKVFSMNKLFCPLVPWNQSSEQKAETKGNKERQKKDRAKQKEEVYREFEAKRQARQKTSDQSGTTTSSSNQGETTTGSSNQSSSRMKSSHG